MNLSPVNSCRHGIRFYFATAGAAGLLALSAVGSSERAHSQEAKAKVDLTSKIYCRYWDSRTNRDKTGVVPGVRSCNEGDGEKLVVYMPCGEPQTMLPRKQLKRSEQDCAGIPVPDSDTGPSIVAKITNIDGNRLTLAYEALDGTETFSLRKDYLKGFRPERNSSVMFYPTDLTSKTGPETLASDFEKFIVDANQGVRPQGIVGYVMK